MKAVFRAPACLRGLERYLRDDRGGSVIEFAIVGPFVFILILATMELALDMMVDSTVQIAAQAASRVGLTTTAPSSGTRSDQAKAVINNILGGWTNVGATITINTLTYGTYSNVSSGTSTNGMGSYGDVVSYNINVTMPPFSGIPKLFGINQLVFQRNYLVQNEK
jgi:Flp pilus assembly protein TadG